MSDPISSDEQNRFVLSYFYGGQRVTVEIPADTNLSDMADALETFLIACGFHGQQVKEMFK